MVKVAQAYLALGDAAMAGKLSRKALQITPGGLDATLVLGYSLLLAKKPSEAEHVLGPAVMLHPRSVTLLCLLGRCRDASGNINDARNYYRQALQLDPENEAASKLLDRAGPEISAARQ